MKTRVFALILALSLPLSALAGCETESPADSRSSGHSAPAQSAEGNPDAGAGGEEIVLDFSDFEMPEATGALTVYATGMLGLVMTPAVERFRELYPEVTVDYQTLSDEEYGLRIETEIPAGSGPDVLFAYSIPDVYKTIETGIFEDLNPYMHNDPDFHEEDFYDVLDVGLLNGVRGILPVEIKLPVLQTTEEALADAGIGREELRTWDGFISAALRYREQHPDNTVFSYGWDDGYLSDMIRACGMDFIDYRNRVPAVDREKMEQLCKFCALDYVDGAETDWDLTGGKGVTGRKVLFENFGDGVLQLTMYRFAAEQDAGEHMIYETIPDVRDGVTASLVSFAAIPRSSANKRNAWRLIMILLSDEIQGGHENTIFKTDYLRIGFPVRRESMERRITETVRDYYGGGAPEYPEYEDEIARDIADISEVYGRMTGCTAVQSAVSRYVWKNIKPFLMGKQSFDKCYDRLYGELELYAGE